VVAADVDGDGTADIIAGAPQSVTYSHAQPIEGSSTVPVYARAEVLFGGTSLSSTAAIHMSSQGSAGVTLAQGNYSTGQALATLDFNHDGVADLVIAAPGGSGGAYVVFGHSGGSSAFPAMSSLTGLSGSNGFVIGGVSTGAFVANAGDVNGDQIDDLLIALSTQSTVSVVFGHAGTTPNLA
jgi:hypothetical protein